MSTTPIFFARQFVAAVMAALIPVILVAFLTIPFNLGGHPGEIRTGALPPAAHMT